MKSNAFDKLTIQDVLIACVNNSLPDSFFEIAIELGALDNLSADDLLILSCDVSSYFYAELSIQAGANVNISKINIYKLNGIKTTPINSAILQGNLGIVKLLIENGADPDNNKSDNDEYKRTALYCACAIGNIEMVKYLVENDCNINIMDCYNNSPLHIASYYGYDEIVKYLLDQGAYDQFKNAENMTALQICKNRIKNLSSIDNLKPFQFINKNTDYNKAFSYLSLSVFKHYQHINSYYIWYNKLVEQRKND